MPCRRQVRSHQPGAATATCIERSLIEIIVSIDPSRLLLAALFALLALGRRLRLGVLSRRLVIGLQRYGDLAGSVRLGRALGKTLSSNVGACHYWLILNGTRQLDCDSLVGLLACKTCPSRPPGFLGRGLGKVLLPLLGELLPRRHANALVLRDGLRLILTRG
jgi:hypothetical protein